MKNYTTECDQIFNIHDFVTEPERLFVLSFLKEMFKNKENSHFAHTILYNVFRKKPMFNGIKSIRCDKFFSINNTDSENNTFAKGRKLYNRLQSEYGSAYIGRITNVLLQPQNPAVKRVDFSWHSNNEQNRLILILGHIANCINANSWKAG